ncbi:RNA-guided pseudouridylation complex pseudouridine synthase subunit Cbf5 [Candidatus Woesearchaeota archaeon]|nr:RNA-guided pseudouridylation complex pseudouridine synthase subunit Cbf5 [Candidatus Woesearchaeota archaeon]
MNKLPFEQIERTILVKKEAKTVPKFSFKSEDGKAEELINYGIVNIDKPKGPTSHQVSDYVQKILKIKKSGHSGTLDPAVTGILPIALGKATRIVQTLLPAGKEYVALMHLHKKVDEKELKKALNDFTGKIKQKPPLKSAVKRVEREREIYYLDVLEIDGQDVLFKVGCQAGTYIRKLCHDIGKRLGCGAHMSELRRTKVATFDESTAFSLQDLTDAFYYYANENNEKYIRKIIQPIENAIKHLPKIWVLDTTINSLCHGTDLKIPGISKIETNINEGETVAVMTLNNELIAIGTTKMDSYDIMEKDKGVAVRIEKVFMSPEIYPNV